MVLIQICVIKHADAVHQNIRHFKRANVPSVCGVTLPERVNINGISSKMSFAPGFGNSLSRRFKILHVDKDKVFFNLCSTR